MEIKDLLLDGANLTLTDTVTVLVNPSNVEGVKIGEGKCKAVILRLNNHESNVATVTSTLYFYYGDSKSQIFEVLKGENSDIIFCTDLRQVFVRIPVIAGWEAQIGIQVMVYR